MPAYDVDDHERCQRHGCDGHFTNRDKQVCDERRRAVKDMMILMEIAMTGMGFTSMRFPDDHVGDLDMTMWNPKGFAFQIIVSRLPDVDSPRCSCCKKDITIRDVNAFREESGSDELPGMCQDCAEIEE